MSELAKEKCQEAVVAEEDERVDLSHPRHLQLNEHQIYKPSRLIKLTFQNVDDLKIMKREILTYIRRHHKTTEEICLFMRQFWGESNSQMNKDNNSSLLTTALGGV